MVFEMSISAYSELHYIESKGQNINITLDEAIAIIESKNIQLGINPFVLNSLKLLAKEYEENKLYAQSLYFYELIYNVSHEEDIFNKINEIDKKLNN
jgi:hypothetical protein